MIVSPSLLFALAAIAILTAGVLLMRWGRRCIWPVAAALSALLLLGSMLEPRLRLARPPRVVVMIDRSASMRGLDETRLKQAIAEALRGVTHRTIDFGADELDAAGSSPTVGYSPPGDADAIVLVSDGRFDPPPISPPTFPMIVPGPFAGLAGDARVTRLDPRDSELLATVVNNGPTRTLRWSIAPDQAVDIPRGTVVVSIPAAPGQTVTARLDPGDRWPENDAMTVRMPGDQPASRWWMGGMPAPPGWTAVAPRSMASGGFDLLDVETVAWVNLPADALDDATDDALRTYVHDLGGTLILVGGESSFAAGGWTGTALDRLSPLSGVPPQPRAQWLMLLDASGSMNVPMTPTETRWNRAIDTARATIDSLPPADEVRVGSFSERLRWWNNAIAAGESPRGESALTPPPDIAPRGPTNLASALREIADAPLPPTPRRVLVITDGEAPLDDVSELAERLRSTNITVLALAVDPTAPRDDLTRLAEATGGGVVVEAAPERWAMATRQLIRSGIDAPMIPVDRALSIGDPLNTSTDVRKVNPTWLREGARLIGVLPLESGAMPLAAVWADGSGRVAAFAFAAEAALIDRAAAALARPPRDPGVRVLLEQDERPRLRVEVDDPSRAVSMRVIGESAWTRLKRVAPRRYEAELDRSPVPRVVEVRAGERLAGRLAVPGRYPSEFDRIGLDETALEQLAERTGGRVIESIDQPVAFPRQTRFITLAPWLTTTAGLVLVMGLIAWRRMNVE